MMIQVRKGRFYWLSLLCLILLVSVPFVLSQNDQKDATTKGPRQQETRDLNSTPPYVSVSQSQKSSASLSYGKEADAAQGGVSRGASSTSSAPESVEESSVVAKKPKKGKKAEEKKKKQGQEKEKGAKKNASETQSTIKEAKVKIEKSSPEKETVPKPKFLGSSDEGEAHLKELSQSVAAFDKAFDDIIEDITHHNSTHNKNASSDVDEVEELREELDHVKETVKQITSTVNETVEEALKELESKDRLINALVTKNKASDLKIDYETGAVKSMNGSIVTTLYDLFLSDYDSHGHPIDPSVTDPAVLQEDLTFLTDFVLLLTAATIGGLLAVGAYCPVFVGFIVGGAVIGPSGLNLVTKLTYIETLSQVGGPLLLFVQGLHLQSNSIKPFSKIMNRYVPLFYLVSIPIMSIVLALGKIAHNPIEAFLLSLCVLVSSSSVSITMARDSKHERAPYFSNLTSMAVVQDILMALLLCVPSALDKGYYGVLVVAQQLIIAILLISISVVIGLKVAPKAIRLLMHDNHPELFLLSMVSLCLGAAAATRYLGLSSEFGAFFSGLALTRTAVVKQAMENIGPIKELFCAMFFASIGMVISTSFFVKHLIWIVGIFLAIFLTKLILMYMLLRFLRCDKTSSFFTSLALAEIGEFSIFVGGHGYALGLLSRKCYLIFLMVTVFSLSVTPFIFKAVVFLSPVKPAKGKNVFSLNELAETDVELGTMNGMKHV